MVFENLQEIVKTINNPKNKKLINYAVEKSKRHNRHVTGLYLDEYLQKHEGYETEDEYRIRKQNTKPYTVSIMSAVMKPFDKIFSARGGSFEVQMTDKNKLKEFESIISNISHGLTLRDYMANFWIDRLNIDPFGILLLNMPESNKPELVYKSCFDFYDIDFTSFQRVEYVIFNPEIAKIDNETYKIYRVLDDNFDYIVINKGQQSNSNSIDNWLIAPFDGDFLGYKSYKNYFTKDANSTILPAIFLSQRFDKANINCTDSWISEALPFADDYILDKVNNNIYKLKQCFPLAWEYSSACPVCNGEGTLTDGTTCQKCDGTGVDKNRKISDKRILPIPEIDTPAIVPPAGYVKPDLETWTKQEETLRELKWQIEEAIWGGGTAVNNLSSNATATEVNVKREPQIDRLYKISDNAEKIENFICNVIGFTVFGVSFGGVNVRYGKRFDTKTVSELWNEYLTAKEKNADTELLNELLYEFYYASYKNSPAELKRAETVMQLKPFFHLDTATVLTLKPNVDKVDYLGNVYFSEFWNSLTESEKNLKIDVLKQKLNEYVKTKEIEQPAQADIINQLNNENGTTQTTAQQ